MGIEMKVLMVGNASSVKGGITSVINQLLKYDWKSKGTEMCFIPTYIEGNITKKILYFACAYVKIFAKIISNRPDIVHIHMSYRGSFIRAYKIHKLCLKHGIPDIVHLHGSEFEKWYYSEKKKTQFKIRKLLRECSAFLVLGNKWNKIVKKIEPNTNTVIIQNTVHIPQETVKWESPCRYLFMGVLIQRKGIYDLLKAVHMLKNSGTIDKYKFIIAGTGPEEQSLKKYCCDSGIDKYVEFVGWITDKDKELLMEKSQVLVLPSYNEGLPIAILEAISYGMPVIATDVGDVSSAVRDHENGILIKPGDIESLSRAITEVGEIYRFTQYSSASKKIALELFNDTKYYSQMTELYQNCIVQNELKRENNK